MRPWFERLHLPIPATIGDGLRTLAGAIAKPDLLLADRTSLYGQAAIFGTRVSELAAELGRNVQRQGTFSATRLMHGLLQVIDRRRPNRGRAQPACTKRWFSASLPIVWPGDWEKVGFGSTAAV
jgi:hypothetical protein